MESNVAWKPKLTKRLHMENDAATLILIFCKQAGIITIQSITHIFGTIEIEI